MLYCLCKGKHNIQQDFLICLWIVFFLCFLFVWYVQHLQNEDILTSFAQILVLRGLLAVHSWAELWGSGNNFFFCGLYIRDRKIKPKKEITKVYSHKMLFFL